MRMEMSPRLTTTLKLAPRMIQSMEILQLPIAELQERIEREMQENPVLEVREQQPEQDEPGEGAPVEDKFNPDGPIVHDRDAELDFKRLEALDKDWDGHFNEEHRPSRSAVAEAGDKKLDAMQNMPSRSQSLQDYLEEQLPFLDLTPEEHEVIEYLIANLDERGYLVTSMADLAAAYEKPLTVEELENVLDLLQMLDPPGIGARDLKECLLLQLTPETPHRELLHTMILHHLDDLANNRLPVIQKRTGADVSTIKDAFEILKRLDPKPGSRFASDNTHYIIPDIIVERTEDGEYTVRLTEDWTPNIHVNRKYMELYRDKASDPKAKEYLRRKIQAAQWLIESIEQRRSTLEKVTKAIISHQKAFLEKKQDYIEPLKMQEIAEQVKVHVTTISRAVDDKWMQTPRGVFPLKRFFGGGTKNEITGEDVAWEKIKQQLLELIGNEDKSNPLSDEDLMKKLQESGYPVARRTVTKYRKMLKIPSSRQRKDWSPA
ncbi:MAG: RNA polymerase factor sigma-54 [Planctomycetes bacterium]|nr:RNA polymerase factor sigma-54 [Planctomycetota bacterium]